MKHSKVFSDAEQAEYWAWVEAEDSRENDKALDAELFPEPKEPTDYTDHGYQEEKQHENL